MIHSLQVHNSLMQTYDSGDWVVHKCANCNVDTHVVHRVKGDSKVFVTNKIEVSNQIPISHFAIDF